MQCVPVHLSKRSLRGYSCWRTCAVHVVHACAGVDILPTQLAETYMYGAVAIAFKGCGVDTNSVDDPAASSSQQAAHGPARHQRATEGHVAQPRHN